MSLHLLRATLFWDFMGEMFYINESSDVFEKVGIYVEGR